MEIPLSPAEFAMGKEKQQKNEYTLGFQALKFMFP